MTIDLLIPFHGKLHLLAQCLQPLLKTTISKGLTIHLIDDGSPEQVDKLPDHATSIVINRIHLKEKVGFVGAVNFAWSQCKNDIVIVLNNDTIPGPNLIKNLAAVLENDPEIAAVGPVSDNPRDLFQFREQAPDHRVNYLQHSFTDYLTAACMAIRRAAIKEEWLFDPRYSPGYFEDLDLCCKLRHRGWKLSILESEYIHHEGSATFGSEPDLAGLLQKNYSRFSSSWSHMPGHYELDQLLWI